MSNEVVWWTNATGNTPASVGYVDQRALPHAYERRAATSIDAVAEAIATLAVRGAPCIGIFGAYGIALARELCTSDEAFAAAVHTIREARPTAVNLAWAVDRTVAAGRGNELAEARAIHDEQRAVDAQIARFGAELIAPGDALLTHCNTGPLATAGFGTALGIVIAAHRGGKRVHVYVDETRPLLQGARLTTFELAQAGVPFTLIADGAAAATMRAKNVRAIFVGADRIATNGDTANKIGTYGVAIAAAHHGIPFYVAAPRSTIDFSLARGEDIVIEERSPDEVRRFASANAAAADTPAYNPAFDVTPGRLIAGIVTEYGIARPPYHESIPDLATRPAFALVHR
jgi:methylthioribose-1-phosphate isomerase